MQIAPGTAFFELFEKKMLPNSISEIKIKTENRANKKLYPGSRSGIRKKTVAEQIINVISVFTWPLLPAFCGLSLPLYPVRFCFTQRLVYLVTPKAFDTHLVNRRLGFAAYQGLSRGKVYIPIDHAKTRMT